jgi:ATP-dependent Clp protease ATP-binding subunit ClpA
MKTGLNTALDPLRRSGDAMDFENALRRKIVGQDPAIEKVTEIYQMFLAGLNPPNRPVGNLLFLGPTGSGKIRVVEAMAEALYGEARACIKIDCAEFQHSHEIAKLIGSPPGYLGHRETHPLLTQEALNQWHTEKLRLSLLLFDEIEKASDSLWQLLLGILDKATLTLGDNRRVDLSQCIIIMTSNLGAGEMNELINGTMGFAQRPAALDARIDEKITRTAQEAARRKFSPEFMNRIDKAVVFKMLKPEHLERILEIELGMVQQRILQATGNSQFVFSCTPRVKRFLLDEGTDAKYGARHLKRAIERYLVFPLANLVATSQVKLGDYVRIDMDDDGNMCFVKEAEGALVPVLLEKYGQDPGFPLAAKAARTGAKPRDFNAASPHEHK